MVGEIENLKYRDTGSKYYITLLPLTKEKDIVLAKNVSAMYFRPQASPGL